MSLKAVDILDIVVSYSKNKIVKDYYLGKKNSLTYEDERDFESILKLVEHIETLEQELQEVKIKLLNEKESLAVKKSPLFSIIEKLLLTRKDFLCR